MPLAAMPCTHSISCRHSKKNIGCQYQLSNNQLQNNQLQNNQLRKIDKNCAKKVANHYQNTSSNISSTHSSTNSSAALSGHYNVSKRSPHLTSAHFSTDLIATQSSASINQTNQYGLQSIQYSEAKHNEPCSTITSNNEKTQLAQVVLNLGPKLVFNLPNKIESNQPPGSQPLSNQPPSNQPSSNQRPKRSQLLQGLACATSSKGYSKMHSKAHSRAHLRTHPRKTSVKIGSEIDFKIGSEFMPTEYSKKSNAILPASSQIILKPSRKPSMDAYHLEKIEDGLKLLVDASLIKVAENNLAQKKQNRQSNQLSLSIAGHPLINANNNNNDTNKHKKLKSENKRGSHSVLSVTANKALPNSSDSMQKEIFQLSELNRINAYAAYSANSISNFDNTNGYQSIQNWLEKMVADHNRILNDKFKLTDAHIRNMHQMLISFFRDDIVHFQSLNDCFQAFEIKVSTLLKTTPFKFLSQRCLVNAPFFNLSQLNVSNAALNNLENKIVLANKFFIYLSMKQQGFKSHANWYVSQLQGIFSKPRLNLNPASYLALNSAENRVLSQVSSRISNRVVNHLMLIKLQACLQDLYAKINLARQQRQSIRQAAHTESNVTWHIFNKSLLLALLSEAKMVLNNPAQMQALINWLHKEPLEHISYQKLLRFQANKGQFNHLNYLAAASSLNKITSDYEKALQNSIFECLYVLKKAVDDGGFKQINLLELA